ncbi:hypothetical protein INT47_011147 [Mucor saturninus]|uniref:Uncharacterized protein n=1 Tax=Mucor saturninus TaxID=64648 RepID=A0A8H7URI7_9FUNG|nr:hypothetical protein INT47_011147 [Mucor saturninus]
MIEKDDHQFATFQKHTNCPPLLSQIPQGPGNSITVSGVRPGNFRWFLHADREACESRPTVPKIVPTRLLLRPALWRRFWSLNMSSKAFTPWQRLIQECVGYRAKLHRWSPAKYPCASCPICDMFEHELDVWSGLVTLCDMKQKPHSAETLVLLGSAFSTLWKYHWRCVIEGDLWNSHAAINTF